MTREQVLANFNSNNMTREQVLANFNSNNMTKEMLLDWADRRAKHSLTPEQLEIVVRTLLMQGFIPNQVTKEIAIHYSINEMRDKNGHTIRWY